LFNQRMEDHNNDHNLDSAENTLRLVHQLLELLKGDQYWAKGMATALASANRLIGALFAKHHLTQGIKLYDEMTQPYFEQTSIVEAADHDIKKSVRAVLYHGTGDAIDLNRFKEAVELFERGLSMTGLGNWIWVGWYDKGLRRTRAAWS
jgi:hypothetical protein